ncbi:MAG: 30S ribosomal protein S8e [Candidatus Woesearchaeota archaeon]
MAILQLRSNRKSTGGRYKRPKVRRLARMGRLPVFTRIGPQKRKTVRTIGGNSKAKLLSVEKVNLLDPKTKKHSIAKVTNVLENPANRHYVRRKILTKGSIIETENGKARVTSRPGQSGSVNAILVRE